MKHKLKNMTSVSASTSACSPRSPELRQTPESEDASCLSSEPSTPTCSDVTKTPGRQRKPLIFEYYKDISVDDSSKATKGKCTKCDRTIQGKYGVTSNFVTHLKVCDCNYGVFNSVQPDLTDCSCMHVTAILLMCLCTDVFNFQIACFCQYRENTLRIIQVLKPRRRVSLIPETSPNSQKWLPVALCKI